MRCCDGEDVDRLLRWSRWTGMPSRFAGSHSDPEQQGSCLRGGPRLIYGHLCCVMKEMTTGNEDVAKTRHRAARCQGPTGKCCFV